MLSPRAGSPRPDRRRWSILAGVAALGLVPATGCQVEYAGMTLPSGKYMHDDVQYFAPGPSFPFANTQAATQRARMSAMGMVPPPPPGSGAAAPVANPNALGNPALIPAPAQPIPGPGAGGAPGAVPLPTPNAPAASPDESVPNRVPPPVSAPGGTTNPAAPSPAGPGF